MSSTSPSTPQSFLVPLDGSEAGFRALDVACDVAKRAHAHLFVLYVIEVPRSLALDAELVNEMRRGEDVLERAERIADRYGVRLDGDLVQARQAGHAVVDEATERGVDAVVIGVDYDRPYGRFALGAMPQYVLEHAPAPVWVIRDRP
jgi:nucleotide-binding universal stress UspA family protein